MYLDSSFELCPRCNRYVLLDQSQRECAKEHGCEGVACPLASYFTGREFDRKKAPNPSCEEPDQT